MNEFCYSYVMGVNDDIYKLRDKGFIIEKEENDYLVTFSKEKAVIWEDFISKNLEVGYWNEYVSDTIIFIFKLNNGVVKKYILDDLNENEILKLCCEFAETQFTSIRDMLLGNSFYKDKI